MPFVRILKKTDRIITALHYSREKMHRQVSNIRCTLSGQLNCWSLRCSWSIACRRCSNYIFILDLIPGINILGKDNCKTRQETLKFWVLVCLILEIWRYLQCIITPLSSASALELRLDCSKYQYIRTLYHSTVAWEVFHYTLNFGKLLKLIFMT